MAADRSERGPLTKFERRVACPCITHDTQGAVHDCLGKPCPCKVTPAGVERLRALLLAVMPSRMGSTPDLAWPVGYHGEDPWQQWENDAQAVLFGSTYQHEDPT